MKWHGLRGRKCKVRREELFFLSASLFVVQVLQREGDERGRGSESASLSIRERRREIERVRGLLLVVRLEE